MSDNHLTHAALTKNVELFHKHEHHENTVDTPRGTTVLLGRFSQTVCLPPLYSSTALHVTKIQNLENSRT